MVIVFLFSVSKLIEVMQINHKTKEIQQGGSKKVQIKTGQVHNSPESKGQMQERGQMWRYLKVAAR